MKIMIASDIHGSAYYCRRMLEIYDREKPDKLLLLGDILYHGPRNELPQEYAPKQVAQMLNEIGQDILCVRGNCDAEVDQMVLHFPIMAEYCILYVNNRMLFATHGHTFHQEHLPPLHKGDILLHGHTHIPAREEHEGYIYLNPGSVAIPKENSRHSCMVWEEDTFSWLDIDGQCYMKWQV